MKTFGITQKGAAKASVIWNLQQRSLCSGKDIEKVLTIGNRFAKRIVLQTMNEVAYDFSMGLEGLKREYGTNNFILGGGIFDSNAIFNDFSSAVRKHASGINLARAELGNLAGPLGAAAFALKENNISLSAYKGVIGIDIGISKIQFIALGHEGKIFHQEKIITPQNNLIETIAEKTIDVILRSIDFWVEIEALGIGAPGIIENGKIKDVSFISEKEFDLKTELGHKLRIASLPISVTNDAEAATIGEKTFGSGKRLENFILITFGSGLGGGFCDKNGEVVNIEPGERIFKNGVYGKWDTVTSNKQHEERFEFHVSTTALLRRINKKLRLL